MWSCGIRTRPHSLSVAIVYGLPGSLIAAVSVIVAYGMEPRVAGLVAVFCVIPPILLYLVLTDSRYKVLFLADHILIQSENHRSDVPRCIEFAEITRAVRHKDGLALHLTADSLLILETGYRVLVSEALRHLSARSVVCDGSSRSDRDASWQAPGLGECGAVGTENHSS